jgi:hypothetical protein
MRGGGQVGNIGK